MGEYLPYFAVALVWGTIVAGLVARHLIRRREARATVEEVPTDDAMEAKAIDLNDPPHYMIYNPKDGVSKLHCTCHGDPLGIGDQVLVWPIPRHPEGARDLFCERTYGQVQR